ncbi:hypothetical protein RJ641_020249 [Dillenia turbinata]|uniref:DNA polymerase epsilon subunit B N-terminal domain-containing protein n=1 Tax=Dillenia turbinata TaxID=194707 RepID=A0AAN8UTC8_9MAGN
MSASMRKKVQKKLKIRGYTLKTEALDEILSFLGRFQDAEDEALDLLLDELENESLKSSILDKNAVHKVVSLLLEAEAAVEETPSVSNRSALRVIDAFLIPKFRYDPIKKVFFEHSGKLALHGNASSKAALYRDRFQLLFQRLSRDKHFSKPAFVTESPHFGSCEISSIQSLIGQTGRKWVMGVISQLEDGHFYLEDLTASQHKITTGFFAENTIVVAEGEMLLEGVFQSDMLNMVTIEQVYTCGFPPLEDRDESLKLIAGLDFFGGGTLTTEETIRLAALEKKAVNDMFVILSDIWLDSEEQFYLSSILSYRREDYRKASDCSGWL